jgi:hypothetical protein
VKLPCIALAGMSLLLAAPAFAATVTVGVDGKSAPWNPVTNPSLDYGSHDLVTPTVVSAPFDFAAGGMFTIKYVSGTVSAGGGFPDVDANGEADFETDATTGNSGKVFPSFYVDHGQYPTYLMELIGAFANSSGVVQGTPFVIGDGPYDATAPSGATELLLGVNDDIFADNGGGFSVTVAGPSGTPEPATWAMLLSGLLGVGAALRSRRKVGAVLA